MPGKEQKSKMRQAVASLHREMEVAPKKRITRDESLKRTKRRKKLEKEEKHEFELLVDEAATTRLRGSEAAYGDEVVQDSLMFQKPRRTKRYKTNSPSLKSSNETDRSDEDDDNEEDKVNENELEEGDEEENDEGDEEDAEDEDPEKGQKTATSSTKKKSKRRTRYRLKNFQSVRMAQRHGDALKFHARGQPKLAIEALKKVAQDAPSAPQVYSSLGMVYEDMLRESLKRSQRASVPDISAEEQTIDTLFDKGDVLEQDQTIPDSNLAEQLDFSKKAYGSYHVAAILCKQDFSLWIKAADCAIDTAEIHGRAMVLTNVSMEIREYHRSEKQRWYAEALGDLKVADNLKPPGIEVPAKLASTCMEVGKLSEALTLLTDLKNRGLTDDGARSEFQSSYKAWLLYADLMLRIGHECIQWNNGIQTNENYMFRRWLRKLSQTFDWQERRLQALSLALEAAAGTKSTEKYKVWMLQRAMAEETIVGDVASAKERWHMAIDDSENSTPQLQKADRIKESRVMPASDPEKDDEENDNEKLSDHQQDHNKAVDNEGAASNEDKGDQFEEEKKLLLEKNCSELEAFDRTTNEINSADGAFVTKDRESTRKAMVKAQEDAIATLEKEYCQDYGENLRLEEVDKIIGLGGERLPISASCRQVCAIASELSKHLHGLELYEGARLVGEAVSANFKERASRYDKRALSRQRYNDFQERLAKSPLFIEPFEENFENDSDDEDETSPFLSDDEQLDSNESSNLLDSLRSGALPPEMRLLFGVALIGEGGRNYVALKCIEKIDDLEQESTSWLRDGALDTTLAKDPLWTLFRRAMTEPFGRTSAYSFLADVLRKTEKEKQWSSHFAPCFSRQVNILKRSGGLLDGLMNLQDNESKFVTFRKNQVLKIIMAASRFEIDLAIFPEKGSSIQIQPAPILTNANERIKMVLSTMGSLATVLHLCWKVEDGNMSTICTDAVELCNTCVSWFSKESVGELAYSDLHKVFEESRIIVSQLCGYSISDLKSRIDSESVVEKDWGQFPVDSSWQSNELKAISLAVYNLVVGCNVSLFSGWEPEEFTLKLLRRRHGNRHFGVHIHDRRITGFVSQALEVEISRQWGQLSKFLPSFPSLDFDKRVIKVKEREWYHKEIEDRKETLEDQRIARFSEGEGLNLYISFSSLCLFLAKSETNDKVRNQLFQLSLSVLLPLSQFCLDETLWDTGIGEAAGTVAGFDEWKLMTDFSSSSDFGGLKGKSYQRRKKEDRVIEKKVQEWIKGTDKPVIRTFVTLPTSEFRDLWNVNTKDSNTITEEKRENAREAMAKVQIAVTQLRSCYTEMATEKASLNVAVLMLELVAQPTCFDPFSCLQQAAIFASQGSKAGSSDIPFRKELPDLDECTPTDALTIIGRADCLQSLYFPNEAAYLCSFVARVCRLHRDRKQPEFKWSDRWRIVAIMTFNVSVLIRTTVSTVLDKEMQSSFLSIWERDVVEELEKARLDGWAWKRKYSQQNEGTEVSLKMAGDETMDESMDEAEDGRDDSLGINGTQLPTAATAQMAHGDLIDFPRSGVAALVDAMILKEKEGQIDDKDIVMVGV